VDQSPAASGRSRRAPGAIAASSACCRPGLDRLTGDIFIIVPSHHLMQLELPVTVPLRGRTAGSRERGRHRDLAPRCLAHRRLVVTLCPCACTGEGRDSHERRGAPIGESQRAPGSVGVISVRVGRVELVGWTWCEGRTYSAIDSRSRCEMDEAWHRPASRFRWRWSARSHTAPVLEGIGIAKVARRWLSVLPTGPSSHPRGYGSPQPFAVSAAPRRRSAPRRRYRSAIVVNGWKRRRCAPRRS
jgi:hypothetical protein